MQKSLLPWRSISSYLFQIMLLFVGVFFCQQHQNLLWAGLFLKTACHNAFKRCHLPIVTVIMVTALILSFLEKRLAPLSKYPWEKMRQYLHKIMCTEQRESQAAVRWHMLHKNNLYSVNASMSAKLFNERCNNERCKKETASLYIVIRKKLTNLIFVIKNPPQNPNILKYSYISQNMFPIYRYLNFSFTDHFAFLNENTCCI